MTPSVTAGRSSRSGKRGFGRRTTWKPRYSAPEDRRHGWQRSPGLQQAGDDGRHRQGSPIIDRRGTGCTSPTQTGSRSRSQDRESGRSGTSEVPFSVSAVSAWSEWSACPRGLPPLPGGHRLDHQHEVDQGGSGDFRNAIRSARSWKPSTCSRPSGMSDAVECTTSISARGMTSSRPSARRRCSAWTGRIESVATPGHPSQSGSPAVDAQGPSAATVQPWGYQLTWKSPVCVPRLP